MDNTQHKLDQWLVALILRGDDAAARQFWARHGPSLLAYAESIRRSVAEDAVQAVFCRLLTLTPRVAMGVADWRAYLAKAVRHEILNRIRSDRRRMSRETGAAIVAAAPSTIAPVESHGVADALEQLPRRLREVVVLRHTAGLSFDQIALALGCNRSTLASRYSSAVRMLKEQLSPGAQAQGTSETLATQATPGTRGDRTNSEVTNV